MASSGNRYSLQARDLLRVRDSLDVTTVSRALKTFVADELQRYADVMVLDRWCVREEPKGSPPEGAIQQAMAHVIGSLRRALDRDIALLRAGQTPLGATDEPR